MSFKVTKTLTSNDGTNEKVAYGPSVWYTDKHLFTYGHELQLPEARLQNWYPSSFTDPKDTNTRFQTMEHYIMWRKAICFDDQETAKKILVASTPSEAQKLGRQVKNFDGKKWRETVPEVAETGNWLKFSQVAECREALLATGDRTLAESNPADRNWGIGFRGDEAAGKENEWGTNLLGNAQMKVRDRLRKEENV
ncbi:DUF1768-domain-containing protein [Aureobasidium pullulans]|uniref:DUF1768-domain-containing protein n=1 Tax=Aureobasidium pullulans TaxID=5580 RepID=A0A4S9D6N4_AURPU|nr:DUF1768-domain-containing protein [Aureobasidium pullulans]